MTTYVFIAASMLRFLDPFTSVYQTDAAVEGSKLSSDPGYWPVAQGLVDPCAKWGEWKPRVVHSVFRVQNEPFDEYDPDKPSPLFKVNQVGYLPDAPKFAYAGAWLGASFGAWKPKGRMAAWELVDATSGNVVLRRDEAPVLRIPDAKSKEGVPFTGENTYEMDFSSVTNAGTYFVRIPGVGRSEDFRVSASSAEDAFRVHMLGLYQKRCGIAKSEPYTHWTSGACHQTAVRGIFPPEEGKLEPNAKWFEIIRDNTDWKGGEHVQVAGGWHDAADYDRRPVHLNIVNDLCAVYLMRPQNFYDGQLSLPENANGIPDILDEAEWGLRHLLAVQQRDGGVGTWIETTAHPGPGSVAERDDMKYAVSRATRRSTLMYAAHAALVARCHPKFREKYLESAKRAWNFSMSARPGEEVFTVKHEMGRFLKRTEYVSVRWKEDSDLPVEYLVKAAVNLAAITGDDSYLEPVVRDMKVLADQLAKKTWNLIPLLYAGERALGLPESLSPVFSRWDKAKLNTAKKICEQTEGAYAYRAPWWRPQDGWVNAMGFGHCHPLVRAQSLMFAHQLTGERRYLDAMSLAADFHSGCNPQGATLTSGLGRVYPVAFLDLPSYVDGIAEYVPGITPYRWTYVVPAKVVELVFAGDRAKASKLPIWRRWGNLECLTVASGEYTVWETIAPAASVTGYLIDPAAKSPPAPRPFPAKRLGDLPGYWMLP